MKSYRVEENSKLIDVVSSVSGLSKKKSKWLIDEGLCCVNGRKELFYSRYLRKGDTVEIMIPIIKRDFSVLYNDEYMLVVSKPPFINTNIDKPNLEDLITKSLKKRVFAIHRLDKQTSGAIMFSRSKPFLESMKLVFRQKLIGKTYLALAQGIFLKDSGRICFPIDGKEAISNFRVIKRFKSSTFLEVGIETGRKHQIRRHLSGIGHPLVGEHVYYRGLVKDKILRFSPRIMLHAYKLSFFHPAKKKRIQVVSKPPGDFTSFIDELT